MRKFVDRIEIPGRRCRGPQVCESTAMTSAGTEVGCAASFIDNDGNRVGKRPVHKQSSLLRRNRKNERQV